jgi:hypothetical protein
MDERKSYIPFHEYMKNLLEKRKQEVIKKDIINELNFQKGSGLTSPTTPTSTEEARLLREYIERSNLLNIAKADESRRKILMLKKFFKEKRYQQVAVYYRCGTKPLYKEGKVSAVGRDFVMLTNLKDRIWIPYSSIESANIPYGIPNYSNTHQIPIYDNNLREKLLLNFGETVAQRDALKQVFYEESLQTNLDSWRDTWIVVHLNENEKKFGKIIESKNGKLLLSFFRKQEQLVLQDIKYVETIRFFNAWIHQLKKLFKLH